MNGTGWTEEEDKALRRVFPNQDIPQEEIVKVFPGRSWHSIQHRASLLRISRGKKGKIDQVQLTKLEKVYKI